jgi:predicted TIM-barrel fold metal-dependent hydrolase
MDMDAVEDDAEVPAFWQALGLPGLIDIHVHFLPEPVLHKVWKYFDWVTELGLDWPIQYRTSDAQRLGTLRALGVRAFSALAYPHKPGMAAWLNEWTAQFAAEVPECLSSATFYPEPGIDEQMRTVVERGVDVVKAHLQVGAYDPRDPLLDPVWGLLAEAGTPVVCHCGSGPAPGEFTGPGPISEVLARHPGLTLVVAHMGLPDYADFLDLAARYPNVHLDTTMVFTPFIEAFAPFPADLRPRLGDLGDRIVLGSDFPNIPYPYAAQLAGLARLDLGDDWLRGVLWDNPARLLRHPGA